MKTSMVGDKGYGVGVEARDSKNIYDKTETEPEFSLKVALKLKDLLINKGYRVVMSRTDFNQNISNHITSPGNNHPVVDWVIHIQPFQRVTKIKRLKKLNYSHKITYF